MKQGEKIALWIAVALLICVGSVSAYLKFQMFNGAQSKVISDVAQQLSPTNPIGMADVRMIPQGLNPNDLPNAGSHGSALLEIYCTQCHDLPSPSMHSAQTWPSVLQRMDKHIKVQRQAQSARIAMPSRLNWAGLETYLTENAQQEFKPDNYDDLDSQESAQFQATCAQCHTLPSPAMHAASEWPRTVLRMKQHMEITGKLKPDEEQTQLIVTYLQKHSASTTAK